jgi:hypothetical protein
MFSSEQYHIFCFTLLRNMIVLGFQSVKFFLSDSFSSPVFRFNQIPLLHIVNAKSTFPNEVSQSLIYYCYYYECHPKQRCEWESNENNFKFRISSES